MGPYEILETVGSGGMGTVFRARHRQTGQIVAVKVMTGQVAADPLLRRRFEREVVAAGRLRHAHLVQGLDSGVEDGCPYLVLEYVEGQTLGERLRQQGPLPEREAIRIVTDVGQALHLLHQHQLIHRDVKPDNILLTKEGSAKLADLGLVKELGTSTDLTWAQTGLGTLVYTAPEQFEDARHADVRCDVYSLGASLYHALTGIPPFQGRINQVILTRKLLNDFLPPRRLIPSLQPHVDQAICQALDASPGKRHVSCEAFTLALLPLSASEAPPGAQPPTMRPFQEITTHCTPEERRRAPRFPLANVASCCPWPQGSQVWSARMRDISVTGLRLRLAHRLKQGTFLGVEILDEEAHPLSFLCARVRWARQVTAGEWDAGCQFDRRLSESELSYLIGNIPTT
jgi:serine/threonine protein kinase